jgi:dTDP-4-dehydrorhamnose 3,5-epimerase
VRFAATAIEGVWVVDLAPIHDERGWFARTFDAAAFRERGLDLEVVQANASFNARRDTLRGLHYQADPHGEPKLVSCAAGAIFDVAVDLRPDSPTHRAWVGEELSAENGRMLYLPTGIAHGFQTLRDDSLVLYQMGHEYVPGAARGVRWDDPAFAIEWPVPAGERTLSDRDASYPDYAP